MIDRRETLATAVAGLKRNALPGFALQAFALVIVLFYYFVPAAGPVYQTVAGWKTEYGYLFSSISSAFFGGVLPFLILWASGRVAKGRVMGEALFYPLFYAYKGMEVDALYRLQGVVFGNEPTVRTIVFKVLADQFIYSAFWAGPSQLFGFLWKDNRFSLRAIRPFLAPKLFIPALATVVLSNWLVWIPGVAIIYSLPPALQLPLANLLTCFWVLLLTFVSKSPTSRTHEG